MADVEPKNSVDQLMKPVPPEQRGQLDQFMNSFLDKFKPIIESSISKTVPRAIDEGLRKLGYTEEVAGLVQLLSARSNDTKDNVIRKALTLYGLALDAREKGNRLAIISPDDMIVHDVIGFEPDEVEAQKAAS